MTCCSAIACSCLISRRARRSRTRVARSGCIARPITRWKRQVDRHGLEMLRPRERRRPQMPNQLPQMVEERIVAFSLAHPGLGPRRIARELARPQVGWDRRLAQRRLEGAVPPRPEHARQAARADRRLPRALSSRRANPRPSRTSTSTRPGELVGIDCFYVGRLHGTEGAVWQLTAIDVYSLFAWAELVRLHARPRPAHRPARFASRVARELKAAGWRLERVLTDNGNEFRAALRRRDRRVSAPATPASTPAARRPTATSKRCTRRSSTNAGDPPSRATSTRATRGLRRELDTYLTFYNHDRVHHGRLTRGRIPADLVYGARKMEPR